MDPGPATSAYGLPPAGERPVRLVTLPATVAGDLHADALDDALRTLTPDVVIAAGDRPATVEAAVRSADPDPPVLVPGRGVAPSTRVLGDGRVAVVVRSRAGDVPPTPRSAFADAPAAADGAGDADGADTGDAPGAADPAPRHVCLVDDALALRVAPTRRETVLEGREEYARSLPDAWLSAHRNGDGGEAPGDGDGAGNGDGADPGAGAGPVTVTHLSTAIRPDYRGRWAVPDGDGAPTGDDPGDRPVPDGDGDPDPGRGHLRVRGAGRARRRLGVGTDAGDATVASLSAFPSGPVRGAAVDPDGFGLRGLPGVGRRRARRLREAGHDRPAAVVEAGPAALTDVPGFGSTLARQVHDGARAAVEGRVVARGDGAPPDGDPVYVDVETDGLAAGTVWLVGVLDGGPEAGRYMAFRQRSPAAPVEHVEAFLDWLLATAPRRPVVAYNGYGFDFPAIRELLREHAPDRLDDWTDRYTFDPLYWARTGDGVVLPGHDDALETVARALGWTPETHGLDGRTAARVYTEWRDRLGAAADPADVTPPDWERLEAYCEDDVRALATVHEALRDAARGDGRRGAGADREPDPGTGTDAEAPTGSDSTQGSLSDFG